MMHMGSENQRGPPLGRRGKEEDNEFSKKHIAIHPFDAKDSEAEDSKARESVQLRNNLARASLRRLHSPARSLPIQHYTISSS